MQAPTEIDPLEARVVAVLIEKEYTTPDQYPLSINALTSGCNQKSNRNPTMDLSVGEVRIVLEGLRRKHLIGSSHLSGGRVERYQHSANSCWGVDRRGLALLAELLLRGPQTVSELRTRAGRMAEFESNADVQGVLDALAARQLVAVAPGSSRAVRYAERLTPDAPAPDAVAPDATSSPSAADEERDPFLPRPRSQPAAAAPGAAGKTLEDRVSELSREVAALRRALQGLASKLGEELEL